MQTLIVYVSGFCLGGAAVYWGVRAAAEHRHQHRRYEPAVRAVLKHLRAHGTANRIQLQQVLATDSMTVLQYVDRMHGAGLIKRHGHDGASTFYTLA